MNTQNEYEINTFKEGKDGSVYATALSDLFSIIVEAEPYIERGEHPLVMVNLFLEYKKVLGGEIGGENGTVLVNMDNGKITPNTICTAIEEYMNGARVDFPPEDGVSDTYIANEDVEDILIGIEAARVQKKDATKREAELREELFEFVKDLQYIIDPAGHDLATWKTSEKWILDQEKLREDHPEIYEKYRKKTIERRLITKPRKIA